MLTKTAVIEKYKNKTKEKKGRRTDVQINKTGDNFQREGNFNLKEKVDGQTLGIKLLKEGYMQAYVDFFYICSDTTPQYINPSEALLKEYQLKKREKDKFQHTADNLNNLRDQLVKGEKKMRKQDFKKAFRIYTGVAEQFEKLKDFQTASYFYKRCLDISTEYKYIEGEAKSYLGLGNAEE